MSVLQGKSKREAGVDIDLPGTSWLDLPSGNFMNFRHFSPLSASTPGTEASCTGQLQRREQGGMGVFIFLLWPVL